MMNSQEIKRQSADNKIETVSSSEQTETVKRQLPASSPTGTQNLTKRPGSTDLSGTNVSKSGRFQLQSIPKAVPVNKRPSPNLPLISDESSGSSSRIFHSSGPLQVQRRGNQLNVGIRLGKDYRLRRHLGNGQCGETWLAKEIGTNNFVVLKTIPQSIQNNENAIKSVLQSYRRVSALRFRQQSGICPVFKLDQDETLGYFMVSAFADALPLNEYYERYCHSFHDFPVSIAVRLLQPVAAVLDFAHAKKITHRMLKPQNILVGKRCGVVVTDFEITEVVRRELVRNNSQSDIISAAHWQAPEVWLDQQYSPHSDQFSLGALACQLITGELPFDGKEEETLRKNILSDEPAIEESFSEQIRLTLRKSLAKNPNDRFSSCSAFVRELVKSPELKSHDQTSSPDIWVFKDFETTLDPLDASRRTKVAFPYAKKPKGYSGSLFGSWLGILSLLTVILLAGVIGTGIALGFFDSFSPGRIIESTIHSVNQKQASTATNAVTDTKTESKTDLKTNSTPDLTTGTPHSDPPPSTIGSSVWSQHVEPIDPKEFDLFVRSATEGDVTAQRRLGEVYFYGKGVKPDYFNAVKYFQLAADQEDASAIYHIGRCSELGLGGLKHDTAQAIELYQKAAKKGSTAAIAALKRLKVEGD